MGIIDHNMKTVASEHEAGDSFGVFELSAEAAGLGARYRYDAFAHAGFKVGGGIAK